MSGGSYEYLFAQEYPPNYLLEQMVNRLDELVAHAPDLETRHRIMAAAEHTQGLIQPEISQVLRNVWKEVEWFDSCDTGEDTFWDRIRELKVAV